MGLKPMNYDIGITASVSFKNVPKFPEVLISMFTAKKSSPLENKNFVRNGWSFK